MECFPNIRRFEHGPSRQECSAGLEKALREKVMTTAGSIARYKKAARILAMQLGHPRNDKLKEGLLSGSKAYTYPMTVQLLLDQANESV